jgi:hypothetical protein
MGIRHWTWQFFFLHQVEIERFLAEHGAKGAIVSSNNKRFVSKYDRETPFLLHPFLERDMMSINTVFNN